MKSRERGSRLSNAGSLILGLSAAVLTALIPSFTETAVANGDTRTINLFHAHTKESISATYLVQGQYDRAVLQQLNWFLRDWRRDEPTNMDPRLFDVVWEAYRSAGAEPETINVVSAYRSPETNAMLRARSRAVAKYSQHMLGKAMDTTMPGMPMSHLREVGMKMQRGGVGYYPTAGTPFVHLDVGGVRSWPRMSYEQLARLFPDGKTVHLPTNNQPLPGYEIAKAEIEARNNGASVPPTRSVAGGFLAFLFGGGGEDEDAAVAPPPPSSRKQWSALAPRMAKSDRIAAADSDEEGGGAAPAPERRGRRGRSEAIAKAEVNLPRGETVLSAASDQAQQIQNQAPQIQNQEPQVQKQAQPEKFEKLAQVRAPLPPERPASIDKTVSEKPTPIEALAAPTPPQKPTAIAALDQVQFRGAVAELVPVVDPSGEKPDRNRVSTPLPPHRPSDLAVAVAEAPLPPVRPITLSFSLDEKSGPASSTEALAILIDTRKNAAQTIESIESNDDTARNVLAYAPPLDAPARKAISIELRPTNVGSVNGAATRSDFVPARLDRSNFRVMTAATPTSRATTTTALGASIGAVRSMARAGQPSVLTPSRALAASGFQSEEAEPPTDKFAPINALLK